MSIDERIQGSLLGLAWGDVLGCPVETWREQRIRNVYGSYEQLPVEHPFDRIGKGDKELRRLRPLGLHSDDTQQAMGLILVALNEPSSFSLQRWSALLVAGMKQGAWRGFGRNFSEAVRHLSKVVPPEQSGSSSAGMGAAMRIAPLGALYRDAPAQLANAAMASSLVTHGDIRAGALAYAVAFAAGELINGRSVAATAAALPPAVEAVEREWLTGHVEWTIDRTAGHLVSRALAALLPLRDESPEKFRNALSAYAKPHLADGFKVAHPNQGFVLLGGLHGLACALRADAEPQAILTEIIRLGYDTDTVGAIAGGVLGARFGTSWIPRERLLDRPRLERYALALIERSAPPETQEEFLAAEVALSQREEAYQAEVLKQYGSNSG